MEKVKEQEPTPEFFENDIDLYLKLFCEEQHIEDLRTQSQAVWNACLMYIQKHAFNDRSILKQKNNIKDSNSIMCSTFNSYDYELVDNICNIYIYYCSMYDKEISMLGFSNLTGIDYQLLCNWRNEGTKLSSKSFDIVQKLTMFREESLSNKLVTGNKNPVGVIAVLNRQFGWASPYTNDSNRQKVAKQDTELPQLGTSNCVEISDNLLLNTAKNE